MNTELEIVNNLVYKPCNLTISQLAQEPESADYGAYTFRLNQFSILFRVAKITPTKAGQFVTLWKRSAQGPIQPYDLNDDIDFFIVCIKQKDKFGQFIFPKAVLGKVGVLSLAGKGGKRAIRVYPPWEKSLNKQAQKTQHWQTAYFLAIAQDGLVDQKQALRLYSCF